MPQFEVAIVYKGQKNFIVEAMDAEEAETLAADAFREGIAEDENNPGEPVSRFVQQVSLGNEWESIENVESYEIRPKAGNQP